MDSSPAQPRPGEPTEPARIRPASEARCVALFLTRLGREAVSSVSRGRARALRAELISLALSGHIQLRPRY